MQSVVIAIPKGRDYRDGFIKSLLALLLYEKGSLLYSISISMAEKPISKGVNKYADIADKRTKLVNDAVAGGFTHLLFLDDDMMFPPNTLRRLMSHKAPFVSGLGFMRKKPFYPTIFKVFTTRKGNLITEKHDFILEYPDTPFVVDGVGLFCGLIDLSIIPKLRTPLFETKGITSDSNIGEDLSFTRKLWEKGYKVLIDPSIKTGHIINKNKVIIESSFKRITSR
jgi:hypothetical protein